MIGIIIVILLLVIAFAVAPEIMQTICGAVAYLALWAIILGGVGLFVFFVVTL